jgi:hypothetical protein
MSKSMGYPESIETSVKKAGFVLPQVAVWIVQGQTVALD